ncbi:MAG: sigma-70 family RNA polymerase sigma factor [Planctomycetota bacterium]
MSRFGARAYRRRQDDDPQKRQADLESADQDREWIARACYGDERAFEQLVTKYQERAVSIARNFVMEEETAKDVAQEAFLRVYRSLHRYDPTMRFYTWFYRIVVHLAIDHLRRRKRTPQNFAEPEAVWEHPGDGPVELLATTEVRGHVGQILERVPEKYRLLLVLRDLEGFSSKEISEIAGWNHATVRWRLHRARKLFREQWESAGLPTEM